ncbi:putative AAA family ATPase [Paratrimastix pyriformis]|uniref:AAA family ATPase n=1 Tax=Paratrimastix pyriformis TaxID=342808 RepID=A0ABQ8UGT0_9EUKA|nr:putative AAA family ATPase [Paratrimastix pyriformis]
MIIWGPPGTGKTSLATVIAEQTASKFVKLSAVAAGLADVREIIKKATILRKESGRSTILFVDEIHRFDKRQQDAFLPHVEDGTITLIGATTENPSFSVINPLLSRSQVITLNSLEPRHLRQVIDRALIYMNSVPANRSRLLVTPTASSSAQQQPLPAATGTTAAAPATAQLPAKRGPSDGPSTAAAAAASPTTTGLAKRARPDPASGAPSGIDQSDPIVLEDEPALPASPPASPPPPPPPPPATTQDEDEKRQGEGPETHWSAGAGAIACPVCGGFTVEMAEDERDLLAVFGYHVSLTHSRSPTLAGGDCRATLNFLELAVVGAATRARNRSALMKLSRTLGRPQQATASIAPPPPPPPPPTERPTSVAEIATVQPESEAVATTGATSASLGVTPTSPGGPSTSPHGGASLTPSGEVIVVRSDIEKAVSRPVPYDKKGEHHFNTISAFIKARHIVHALHRRYFSGLACMCWYAPHNMNVAPQSMRGGCRRLIRFASEDVGLADPHALPQAVAAWDAVKSIGMPEADVCLAQAAAYMARAPKSPAVYFAYGKVKELLANRAADPIPKHICNAPTALMKEMGYARGYVRYPDAADGGTSLLEQTYLPEPLVGTNFFDGCELPEPPPLASKGWLFALPQSTQPPIGPTTATAGPVPSDANHPVADPRHEFESAHLHLRHLPEPEEQGDDDGDEHEGTEETVTEDR